MSVAVYVSGDVSGRTVTSAQDALVSAHHGGTPPDVRLVPLDLDLGFDINIALNAVSTLTTVATFVYTLISAKAGRGKKSPFKDVVGATNKAGTSAENLIEEIAPSDVQVSVRYASKPDEEPEWTLSFSYPKGENHIVLIRQTASEEFDVNIKQVKDG